MHSEPKVIKPPIDEPVFNTFRRKPLRPFYSLREVQIGVVILLLLGGVTGWVIWRGAHPEAGLFTVDDRLLSAKGKDVPIYERPVLPWTEPGSVPVGPAAGPPRLAPFPDTLVSDGWRIAAPPQMFDESNLYSKINGRETFYKSYGFQKLHFVSLSSTAPAGLSIDIELFDLGSAVNALGAMVAEISNPGSTQVDFADQALAYTTRNGGFLAKGRYYARMIGSDEAPAIQQKVAALRAAFIAALPGESLPWAYELFVGGLGLSPAGIQYHAENAFSFGFANEFYSATMSGGETELFLSQRGSADEARNITAKMAAGFAEQGQAVGGDGLALFKNHYIESFDGVQAAGVYVIGVRLAPTPQEARKWMNALRTKLEQTSDDDSPSP